MPDRKLSEPQMRRLFEVGKALVSELDLDILLGQVLVAAKDFTGARQAALGLIDIGETTIDFESNPDLGADQGVPQDHPPTESSLTAPILIRGETFGNIYLNDKVGADEFNVEDQATLEILAELAAVAVTNCRVHRESEHRRTELERSVLSLEANVSFSRLDPDETGTASLLESVATRARALIECRTLLILAPDESDGLTVCAVAGAAVAETGQTIYPDRGLLENVRRDGLVNRLDGAVFKTADGRETVSTSSLMVVLDHLGTSQGYALAIDPVGRESFEVDDELLLQSFAGSAANSLAATRGVERSGTKLAIEASELERRRWAMELHDETLQDLGALKMLLEGALRRGNPEFQRQSFVSAIALLGNTIASLESLIQELRPATLDALGVSAAVETLVDRMNNRSGLGATLHTDLAFDRGESPTRLDPQLEATIYRVVQESLNNVAKHAEATRTSISIVEIDDQITIFIEDDGKGFPATDGLGDRFGLHGMKERVQISDGTLEIDSAPGKGTRVAIHLPSRTISDTAVA